MFATTKLQRHKLLLLGLASLWICGDVTVRAGEVPTVRGSSNAAPGMTRAHEQSAHTHVMPTNAIAQAVQEGFAEVGFDVLSSFVAKTVVDSTGLKLTNAIPDEIKALDGKRVVIAGFMRPLTMHEGLTTSFLLLKSEPQCCMGGPPQLNEWVIVRMTGGGVKSIPEKPVAVCGTLSVGEYLEEGRLRAIYVMDGESVRGPDPE